MRIEGRRWVLRYRVDTPQGRVRRSLPVGLVSELRSRSAARIEADRLLALRGIAPRLEGKVTTLLPYADAYLQAHVTGIVRESSERAFRGILRKHVLPEFGSLALDAIDVPRVQQFIAALGRQGLAVSTIRGAIKLLRQMLKAAHAEGFAVTPIGPWVLKFPKDSRAERVARSFSPEESTQIIAAAEGWLKALCAVLAFTGCRCGEALGLRWSHVDFERGRLLVRQAAVDGQLFAPKTSASAADLPMPEALAAILRAYRQEWQANAAELLFAGKDGRPRGAGGIRRRHFAPLLQRLGLAHGGLHGFRHGMASALFAEGVGAPTVQAMLRHGNLRTTMRYAHSSLDLERRGADAVASRIHTRQEVSVDV